MKSAISAFESNSDFSLKAISRATYEWYLQALFLLEPIFDLYRNANKSDKVHIQERSEKYSFKQTVDRLRAYTAWCLWNDRLYYKEVVNPKTLDGVWDRTAAKSVLEDEENYEWYEKCFGELNIDIDKDKVTKGREEMNRAYCKKIETIDKYLSDSSLKPWIDKIKKNKTYRFISFFDLFDSRGSVPAQLHKYDVRFPRSL